MRSHGFTLVESMIAALLTVLIVASALTLVARGRAAHRSWESRSRLEETAGAALDLLAFEIRMAGFLGLLPPGSPVAGSSAVGAAAPAGLGVAGGCVPSLALDLAMPVAGADGAYAARPGLPVACPPSPSGRVVTGSDTLVLRRAAAEPGSPDAGRLQLESTRRAGRLITDGVPALGDAGRVHDLEVSVLYVSADTSGERGRPSLRRKRLIGGAAPAFQDEELVPGIADLQVEGGVDLDGDGAEDACVTLDELGPGTRTLSLRLWVLVESDLPEAAALQRPALAYANRTIDASASRYPRLLASRVVELRNTGAGL